MNPMNSLKKMWVAVTMAAILPLMTACGGKESSLPSQPIYLYTVGGTVAGLNGTLVLHNNGGNPRTISANGPFNFSTTLTNGSAYNVTVYSKPSRQTCTVSSGSGTIQSANVTNVQVVCVNSTGGVTLSGRIKVPSGVVIDGSVNDRNERYVPNETFESAQVLPNPISVGGYVNQPRAGKSGRSYFSGNPDDYYKVQLKAGDVITLATGASDPQDNDLDICLYDGSRSLVDCSVGDKTYEYLVVPSDGTYFVNVYAYRGASNYILTIGADAAAEAIASNDPGILSSQQEIVPDQAVVRFKDTVKTAAAANQPFTQYAADMGLTVVAGSPEREMLMGLGDLKFQAYADKADDASQKSYERNIAGNTDKARLLNTLLTIKELRKRPDVLYTEPNYIVHSYGTVPDDAYYGLQWDHPLINLPEAWDVTTGSDDVIVAVVDSGVLMNHPDLDGRLTRTGYNFVKEGNSGMGPNPNDPGDKEPGTSRSSFHGTHVAGTIAAKTNNNAGVAGVTWKTMIMPVRVMGAGGSGTTYDVRQGIRYAAGLENDSKTLPAKPADIINLSLGGSGRSDEDQRVINEVRAKGIIVIAAAGNENTSRLSYPASYDGVISVSAVKIDGSRASYSNYGQKIKVAAPGGDSGDLNGDGYQDYILSTGGDDSSGSVVYRYTFLAGTSMAAPHVAGVVALMKAVYPKLSPKELDDLLAAGKITNNIGAANYYGYGLINAFKAVAAARELAGGASISGIDVNPRTVNFDAVISELSVTVSRIGTGAISVSSGKNADWLTVVGDSVDGAGFGRYIIRVDRSSSSLRQEGTYQAVVIFTSSSGTSVSVSVTVQVRANSTTYDAGYHYVLLYNVDNFAIEDVVGVRASGGYYQYAFNNVPPGKYMVIAGSDRNNDAYIDDGGEAFGAYPTINQMVVIDAADGNRNDLDFTTNLILSISGNSVAIDNLAVPDKPDAVLPESKRLLTRILTPSDSE